MSGSARSRLLGRLLQEAFGSMWEIEEPLGSRSAEACQASQTPFLVRAGKSRRVQENDDEISSSLTRTRAFPSQGSRPFEGRARHGHSGRSTQLQLAFGK
jgi:hypothetical protein